MPGQKSYLYGDSLTSRVWAAPTLIVKEDIDRSYKTLIFVRRVNVLPRKLHRGNACCLNPFRVRSSIGPGDWFHPTAEYRYHSYRTTESGSFLIGKPSQVFIGGVIQQVSTIGQHEPGPRGPGNDEPQAEPTGKPDPRKASRQRWLLVIGLFKFAKGVFFILIGVGVLKLVHRDLADLLLRLALSLRIDPESHLVNLLMDKAQSLTPHRLRWIGTAVFFDAGLDFIEATGLMLRKAWAEYFTLILTASFLPWELFEIIRHVTAVKIVLTLVNLLVVIYLAYILKQRDTAE